MRLDCNTSNVLLAGSTVRCWCGTKMLAAFQNNMGRPYIPRLAGDWQVFPLALRMLVSLLNGCLHEHRQCIQGSSLPVALIVPLEIKRIFMLILKWSQSICRHRQLASRVRSHFSVHCIKHTLTQFVNWIFSFSCCLLMYF